MKVALSTSVIQRGKTGVARYVLGLTRALLEHGKEVDLHLLVLEEDLPLFEFARDKAQLVTIRECWRPAVRNVIWHQAVLPKWLAAAGIEVLHIPSYRRMLAYSPCPQVTTIHDLAPFHLRGKYNWPRMAYARFVVPLLARRQQGVIAVSQNTAADVRRFLGVAQNKLTVIPNGLDTNAFREADRAAARRIVQSKWGLAEPFFVYVSRLEHPAKNHVRLIQAFDAFKRRTGLPWNLVLGGSDWHGAENIHAAAKGSPFSQSIKLLGFIEERDLPALYGAAEALVYPSLFEGFGFPPLEAMACGCPVLCSPAGSLSEIVGDAAGLFNPFEVAEMTEKMVHLALTAQWREDLRNRGLKRAQQFSWARVCKNTIAAYNASMGHHA